MVKQFDIALVDFDPAKGKEKGKYRPCVIISNDLLNSSNTISWVMPITSRSKRFPSDIPLKTKNNKVTGIIDTVQIRAIDLSVRDTKIVDTLQEKTKAQIILMTTWSPKGGEHAADDKQFDQIVYKIAKQKNLPVADLSTIWEHNDDVTGPAGKTISDFSDYLTRDNFHPNQLGHDKIAELLNKELNREGTYER